MKSFLMLLLLTIISGAYAEDRYPFPDRGVYGMLGCRLDGTVKFADIRNYSERLRADTLVGLPCLEVLADLSHPANVKVGSAIAARVDGGVPDEIEEQIVFTVKAAGEQSSDSDSVGFLACELSDNGRLTSVGLTNPYMQLPQQGESCIDFLYQGRANRQQAGPPVAAALFGSPSTETLEIEECLIFDIGAGGNSAAKNAPIAQLVCDYTSTVNNLVVAAFHCLPGKCDDVVINPGESCATAMKKVIAIVKPFKLTRYKATSDQTMSYPIDESVEVLELTDTF